MAKYTINEDVHVSMQLHGESVELELTAGDVELDEHVARVLVAQGLAAVAGPKPNEQQKTETPETETESVELELTAGDVELDEHVARVLVAQGLAAVAGPKPNEQQKTETPETETEPLEQI